MRKINLCTKYLVTSFKLSMYTNFRSNLSVKVKKVQFLSLVECF